jgi:hypothetical protein
MAIITERGRWANSTVDERGRRIFANGLDERGRKVFGLNSAPPSSTVRSNSTNIQSKLSVSKPISGLTVTSNSSATAILKNTISLSTNVKSNTSQTGNLSVSGTTPVPITSTVKSNSNVSLASSAVTRRFTSTVKSNSHVTGTLRNSIQMASTVRSLSGALAYVTIAAPNFQVYLRGLHRSNSFTKPLPVTVMRKISAFNRSVSKSTATLLKLQVVDNMIEIIRFKRGNKANLPSLQLGEPAITQDTNELYVGMTSGNVKIPTQPDLDSVNTSLAQNTQQLNNIGYQKKLTYKGASVTTFQSYTLTNYNPIFSSLKADNCDAEVVQLVGVASGTDSTFQTLMDDSILNSIIQAATTNNVKIQMLKLHVNIGFDDSTDKTLINPTDIPTWFTNYTTVVNHYAQIAQANNIPILAIGNELKSLSLAANASYWQTLINNVKTNYPNLKISYAGKYSEWTRALSEKALGQANLFDYVDIQCMNLYPNLSTVVYNGSNITLTQLKEAMYSTNDGSNYIAVITGAYNTYKKDIIISETGMMAKNSSQFIMPSNELGSIDERVQDLYFQTIFETFGKMHQVVGLFIWHTGSPFDFFGRLGETTIRNYFGGVL